MTIARLTLTAAILALAGCINVAPPLSANIPRAALVAQPVVRALERPPLFTRSIAEARSGISGGPLGFLLGEATDAALNANNQNRTQINLIATPTGSDPAALIEETIATPFEPQFCHPPGVA